LHEGENAVIDFHKFKVGQTVEVVGASSAAKSLGAFKILRLMPSERGVLQYRIKSVIDGHERMVTESELS
jgi:ABC-type microcin C transport system duplicated ATPase subunit YejF